jgi:hypothetical protein
LRYRISGETRKRNAHQRGKKITAAKALEKHRDVQMSSALDEFKKPIEDWARAHVDEKPMENLLILYKLLYALGCRIDGIDFEIDRLCVAAIKKAKTLS